MTQRTEITDEMIERLLRTPTLAVDKVVGNYFGTTTARKALDAALNPPAEPEIPVSEAMGAAGFDAYFKFKDAVGWDDCLRKIYQAMEKKRRVETEVGCGHTHKRCTDPGWDTPFAMGQHRHSHRRKDDLP